MKNYPFIRLYVSDFVGSSKVSAMTLEEVGAYVLLLFHSWREGPLEDDPKRLARVIRASPQEFDRIWPAVSACFKKAPDGRLYNERMEKERKKAVNRSDLAQRAARARWDRERVPEPELEPEPPPSMEDGSTVVHGGSRMSVPEILNAWVAAQDRTVSPQERTAQKRFAFALSKQYSRQDIMKAFVGITQVWEHGPGGRPWDLRTLLDKFSLAVSAADNHPEIKANRQMDEFLRETEP